LQGSHIQSQHRKFTLSCARSSPCFVVSRIIIVVIVTVIVVVCGGFAAALLLLGIRFGDALGGSEQVVGKGGANQDNYADEDWVLSTPSGPKEPSGLFLGYQILPTTTGPALDGAARGLEEGKRGGR
jgi:hypothetical protein